MLMRILRILAGYILGCVAFGVVLAAFVFTPAELVTSNAASGRLSMAGAQALLSATQVAIFPGPLALIAAIIAEWRRADEWLHYAAIAMGTALIGFLAQYFSELQGQPSIVNNYALTAFLTGGLVSGLVYWVISGRHAGAPETAPPATPPKESSTSAAAPTSTPEKA